MSVLLRVLETFVPLHRLINKAMANRGFQVVFLQGVDEFIATLTPKAQISRLERGNSIYPYRE
jgi:hypothetical protein